MKDANYAEREQEWAAELNFWRDHPDRHLSNEFKAELLKKWPRRYHGARVKVEILALRPNGAGAPVGSRITIEPRKI